MRILCTGTTGFIAGTLATKLIEQGHDVTALQRYVSGRAPYNANLKTVFANLNDHFAIQQVIRQLKPEVVFHLAALSPVAFSYNNPVEYLETNFVATSHLAECCMRENSNFKQFIFAGTSEEYGNQTTFPIKEDARLIPNSPYAVSKVAADTYLNYLKDAYGFPITIVRPFNTYGRARDAHFIVERIITQMLHGDTVYLGDPEPKRDLMFMDDHVSAYLSVLDKKEAVGETFNFCTGKGTSIHELARAIKFFTKFMGKIVWNTIPIRPLDIHTLIGDASKAEQLLNWKAKWSLEDGLKRTIKMLKENG
jgi:nucleoside-diphosphate-sugar epimerase